MAKKYKARLTKHDAKVGKRVKELRKGLFLTQEKLAEKLKISSNHLSYIETGNRRPSLSLARKIARELKTDLGELFAP